MTLDAELSQSQEERLQEVIAAYLRDVEAGRNPDQAELLTRHPDLAGELQSFFAGEEQIGRLAAPLRQVVEPILGEGITGTLGDFRIVREVGRGGMGIVYEAEQISLRRRVALKVLPFAATMDAKHLQRFHNEAQAAACLHHTNIVPVYSVGSERGVHFYAMQFIDGQPLSEIIRQMRRLEKKEPLASENGTAAYHPSPGEAASTPPVAEMTPLTGEGRRSRDYYRKVAELGIQAAEALDHAHQLGIVHRDIKPGNLMLDGTGRVWVTDFGLAHMQHSEASLTATGQVVGTPRYMSPEQALAKRVPIDHRTDVYSLGVTLYELLALRPAFTSEDRHELQRQIAFEDPLRPRRLERAVPTELETIVLKAMEKRPQDRYATAQELADDLRHWLDDRPIRARRPSWVQAGRRWARRHQAAVCSALLCSMLVTAAVGASVGWVARDRAMRLAKATNDYNEAIDQAIGFVQAEKWPEAKAAINHASVLLASAGNDPVQAQRLARLEADLNMATELELVRLSWRLSPSSQKSRANSLYSAAFGVYKLPVLDLEPDEAARRITVSNIRMQLLTALGEWAEINPDLSEKKKLTAANRLASFPWPEQVQDAQDHSVESKLLRIAQSEKTLDQSTTHLWTLGLDLARFNQQAAITFLRRAQQRHPDDFWINWYLGVNLGEMVPPQMEEAIGYLRAAVALHPQSPGAHRSLGCALMGGNDRFAFYGKARDQDQLEEEAVAEFRKAIRLRPEYASAYGNLGSALLIKRRLEEAISACREAIRLDPDTDWAHSTLAFAYILQGRWRLAAAECTRALELKPSDHRHWVDFIALSLRNGDLAGYRRACHEAMDRFEKTNRPEIADRIAKACLLTPDGGGELQRAVKLANEGIPVDPTHPYTNYFILIKAIADYRAGRFADAVARLPRPSPVKGSFLVPCITAFAVRAMSHQRLGQTQEAREALVTAKALLAVAEAADHPNFGRPFPDTPAWEDWLHSQIFYREAEKLLTDEGNRIAATDLPLFHHVRGETLANIGEEELLKKRFAVAARRFAEAFAEEPKLAGDLKTQRRYNAACAAALAGCGQGADADKLDTKQRARLRQQALDWLRADLKAYRQMIEKSADKARPLVLPAMLLWLQDADFAGVRGDNALAKLPEEERSAWRKLWADVAEMLTKAQGNNPAEKKADTK